MIEAFCTALAVTALGAAVRPRAETRRIHRPTRRRVRWRWPSRARRGSITAADVAAWCESLARAVRSGSSLGAALRDTAAPDSCTMYVDQVVLALERGSRLADSLAVSTTSPHLHLALTVIRACAVNGGPSAEPLDRAAATLRGRAADADDRRTQSAQARLSAIVMTVLPVAMLALLLITSSTTRSAAAGPVGSSTIVVGFVLNLVGWRWMRRIIDGAAR